MTLLNSDSFKPLSTAPAARPDDEFQVTVVANPHEVHPFRPLTSASTADAAPTSPASAKCEPHVSLQRDGDRITHIRVHCSCGQVMDLACAYDAPSGKV